MPNFDVNFLYALNGFIGKSPSFDAIVYFLSNFHPIKMTPMILILWGSWFQRTPNNFDTRKNIIKSFFACLVAMIIARTLALLLPFRFRPIHNPNLHLNFPSFVSPDTFNHWSSFPSDHAVLGFSLATCIFLLNRKWGILAITHTLLFICLPRMYLSLHYPSDILGGALIGILMAWMMMRTNILTPIANRILLLEKTQPVVFYVFFLVLASQLIEMFESTRRLFTMLSYLLNIQ